VKIGITGVAGFIGSNLADALLQRGHGVIGLDDLSMGSLRNIEHHTGCPNFEFHLADVRDLPTMQRVFREADRIVHLAAFKIPRYGKAIDTLEINNVGGRNVLEVGRDPGFHVGHLRKKSQAAVLRNLGLGHWADYGSAMVVCGVKTLR
jgi:UDP-glucose 4-epimerase